VRTRTGSCIEWDIQVADASLQFTHLSPADTQRFADAVQRYGAFHKLPVRVV